MSILARLLPAGLRQKLRLRFMHGETVHCPVCDRGAIAFLPSGTPPRPHAICAFCGSLERARMAWLYLRRNGLPKPGTRMLHVAPEKCLLDRFRKIKGLEYIAGDKFEPGYKWEKGTIPLDVTDLQFPDDHFDLLLCSHVLEHVTDDRKAMRELYRVMKPGGLGLLMHPVDEKREKTFEDPTVTDPKERLRLFGQFDHVRIYGRDHVDRLREAGFTVNVVDLAAETPYVERFRYGMGGDKLYVVGK